MLHRRSPGNCGGVEWGAWNQGLTLFRVNNPGIAQSDTQEERNLRNILLEYMPENANTVAIDSAEAITCYKEWLKDNLGEVMGNEEQPHHQVIRILQLPDAEKYIKPSLDSALALIENIEEALVVLLQKDDFLNSIYEQAKAQYQEKIDIIEGVEKLITEANVTEGDLPFLNDRLSNCHYKYNLVSKEIKIVEKFLNQKTGMFIFESSSTLQEYKDRHIAFYSKELARIEESFGKLQSLVLSQNNLSRTLRR